MKAMVLAAGLGTRLKPITEKIPKALVKSGGRTLLEMALDHLKDNGIHEVVINVHHFAEQITRYLNDNRNFGMDIAVSDETAELLDTGGGLVHASWFFKDHEPFIVRNVDIISDMDLIAMAEFHRETMSLATLAVRKRETSRYFLFSGSERLLCGWKNVSTGETVVSREAGDPEELAFSGIQVIDPVIFGLIRQNGKFSLTAMYLDLAKDHRITGYCENNSYWEDAGKLKR